MKNQGTIEICTFEGVIFRLETAGPVVRFISFILDQFVVIVLSIMLQRWLAFLFVLSTDMATALLILSYFVLQTGYAIVLEWFWRGRTIGKRVLGLRVIDVAGLRLAPYQVIIRNIWRFIDSLPILYLVGGIVCVLNPRMQRLGDIAANTVVVRDRNTRVPDVRQLLGDRYNSLLAYPHLCARLRKAIPAELAQTALETMVRREQLEPNARLKIFHELAELLRKPVQFPEEAVFGLTDEQFIRNAIEAIYTQNKGSV